MNRPFFRRPGMPIIKVPISTTSHATPFNMPNMTEQNINAFMFINPTPFDIRLRGSGSYAEPADTQFYACSETTGWLILARASFGPFTTQNPRYLAAYAWSNPGNPVPSGADFTGMFLELVYGEGN